MKPYTYIAAAVALATAIYQLHNYIYNQGRQAERAAMQSQINEALAEQQTIYRQQFQSALNAQASDHASEISRIRDNLKTEVITKEIIRYVETEVVIPGECNDLANDVVSLLKQTTAVIHSAARAPASNNKPGAAAALPTDRADTGRTTAGIDDSGQQCSEDSRLLSPPSQLSRCGDTP